MTLPCWPAEFARSTPTIWRHRNHHHPLCSFNIISTGPWRGPRSNGSDISEYHSWQGIISHTHARQWKAFNFFDVSSVKLSEESASVFGVRTSTLISLHSLSKPNMSVASLICRPSAPAPRTSSSDPPTASSTSSPPHSRSPDHSKHTMPARLRI